MKTKLVSVRRTHGLAWLAEAEETSRPLTAQQPIWVRRALIQHGQTVPRPEYHPYCEVCIYLSGEAVQYAGRYQFRRWPGDIYLGGPGLPHYGYVTKPLDALIVYFLPSVLLNLDPQGDGARILHRFIVQPTRASICFRPPPPVFQRLVPLFESMLMEFERPKFGSKLKLEGLLVQTLVEIMRADTAPPPPATDPTAEPWIGVERALHFLREHYTERIYAAHVAAAAGVSQSQLRRLFQRTLGASWVHYLQEYRIHRAAAMLFAPARTVTETAYDVGFEDLGHFIAVFRKIMGVSPSQYIKKLARQTPAK